MLPYKKNKYYRCLCSLLVCVLSFSLILSPTAAQAQSILNLPIPGTMIAPSPAFVPVLLKGMTIYPDDPLKFDFIIDSGNTDFTQDEIKKESEKLVKYFLASMTVPKDDLWVNLSPYEDDRIIPDALGKTELGRDMLAQDYILKQLTASLMYPEDELGKKFWDRVYQKAEEEFGTSEIPVNTFNKVWILPESATVYEHEQTVYIVDSRFKVMLDSDYLAREASQANNVILNETEGQVKDLKNLDSSASPQNDASMSAEIIREIIIPEIEREVNEGAHFAPLRQIYHSLILAKWYKETIKNSLLSQVYVDKNLTDGVDVEDKQIKDKIYAQYMEAYKKGVFNYIKEDYDALSQEMIPRKYFSGGIKGDVNLERSSSPIEDSKNQKYRASVEVVPQEKDGFFNAGGDDLLQYLNKNKKFQEVLSRIKIFSTDVGGTLKDGDPDNLNKSVEALSGLLKTGMPVRIVSMGGLDGIVKGILSKIDISLRKKVEVFWGGGVIKTLFDRNGKTVDVTKELSSQYKEKYFISTQDYEAIEGAFNRLGFKSPIYKNDADGVGTAQFGLGKFQSLQERNSFRESLRSLLSSDINEKIDILDDGDGVNFIALVVRRKGAGKASSFGDLLDKYSPDEITYIGDENFPGGADEPVAQLGVITVAVDKNLSKAHESTIRFNNHSGVLTSVSWIRALVESKADQAQLSGQIDIFELEDESVQQLVEWEAASLRSFDENIENVIRDRYKQGIAAPIHSSSFPDGKTEYYYSLAKKLVVLKHKEGFSQPTSYSIHLLAAIFYSLGKSYEGELSNNPEEALLELFRKNNIRNVLEVGTGENTALARILNDVLKKMGGDISLMDIHFPHSDSAYEGLNRVTADVRAPGKNLKGQFDIILSSGVLSYGGAEGEFQKAYEMLQGMLEMLSNNKSASLIANGMKSHILVLPQVAEEIAGIDVWSNAFRYHSYYDKALDARYAPYGRDLNRTFTRLRYEGADLVVLRKKILKEKQGSDSAVASSPGGIDMNEIAVDRQGAGVDIQFDPLDVQAMIDMGITGFAPVIINLTPLPSVLPLLGLAPREEDYLEISSLN